MMLAKLGDMLNIKYAVAYAHNPFFIERYRYTHTYMNTPIVKKNKLATSFH